MKKSQRFYLISLFSLAAAAILVWMLLKELAPIAMPPMGERQASAAEISHPIVSCHNNLNKIASPSWRWSVNTSNPSKREEFNNLFARHGLNMAAMTAHDLPEIESSEVDVVVHKASQIAEEGVIVEDSSLEVEGAQVGVNVKWLIDRIPSYIGRKAILTALIAYRVGEFVYVYRGQVEGTLVAARGQAKEGSPLNAYFQPRGETKTLAEAVADAYNPRAMAFKAMVNKDYMTCTLMMRQWAGAWQKGDAPAPATTTQADFLSNSSTI